MVTDTAKSKSLWASKRHIGMVADAAALGVSRFHLWAVLTKRRESKPLLARYRARNSQPTTATKIPPQTKTPLTPKTSC